MVGSINPFQEEIKKLCDLSSAFKYHNQPAYYEDLLVNADLVIGAGGASVWERCYIGLPSIVLSFAENQVLVCSSVDAFGAHIYIGSLLTATLKKLNALLEKMNMGQYISMMQKGFELVDGKGVSRVERALEIGSDVL